MEEAITNAVIQTQDIMALLDTHKGDYAAACSMDFMYPPHYYDTFALRDSEGYEPVMSSFPDFRSRASRNAIISGQPVPVQSCWNGVGKLSYHQSRAVCTCACCGPFRVWGVAI